MNPIRTFKGNGALSRFERGVRAKVRASRVSHTPGVLTSRTTMGVRQRVIRKGSGGVGTLLSGRVQAVLDDYLTVEMDSGQSLSVAKPHHLRCSNWNPGYLPGTGQPEMTGNGSGALFAFHYQSASIRWRLMFNNADLAAHDVYNQLYQLQRTDAAVIEPLVPLAYIVESECIWPDYAITYAGGTLVNAVAGLDTICFMRSNTGLTDADDAPITYQDLNIGARRWARTTEVIAGTIDNTAGFYNGESTVETSPAEIRRLQLDDQDNVDTAPSWMP